MTAHRISLQSLALLLGALFAVFAASPSHAAKPFQKPTP